jgi:hypothetical protein
MDNEELIGMLTEECDDCADGIDADADELIEMLTEEDDE